MSARTEIERFIEQYSGTAIGEEVRTMLNNDADLEYICEYAGIPYEDEQV